MAHLAPFLTKSDEYRLKMTKRTPSAKVLHFSPKLSPRIAQRHSNPIETASLAARVHRWHATTDQQSFTCAELTQALGHPTNKLTQALYLLGWQRTPVWDINPDTSKRRLSIIWTAPGAKPPRPKRGRPELDLDAMLHQLLTYKRPQSESLSTDLPALNLYPK
jgi:hypothetical protein